MGVDRRVRRGLLVVALALLGGPGAGATVYTVGAHGAYSSLGAALAAAASDKGVADVRVEVGWYGEFDLDTAVGVGRELLIRGGWNQRFSRRTDDPAATVLDAQGRGRILQVLVDSGKLTVRGLTFRGALSNRGAFFDGALVVQGYSGETLVERCAFVDNRNVGTGPFYVTGAALVFFTMGDGNYRAFDNVFRDNRIEASGVPASAAAIYGISLLGTVEVSRNRFQGNVVDSDVETLNYATYLQTQVGRSCSTTTWSSTTARSARPAARSGGSRERFPSRPSAPGRSKRAATSSSGTEAPARGPSWSSMRSVEARPPSSPTRSSPRVRTGEDWTSGREAR